MYQIDSSIVRALASVNVDWHTVEWLISVVRVLSVAPRPRRDKREKEKGKERNWESHAGQHTHATEIQTLCS